MRIVIFLRRVFFFPFPSFPKPLASLRKRMLSQYSFGGKWECRNLWMLECVWAQVIKGRQKSRWEKEWEGKTLGTSLPPLCHLKKLTLKQMHVGELRPHQQQDKFQDDKEEPVKVALAAIGQPAGCLHFTKSPHLEPPPQVSFSAYPTSNYSNIVT